MEQFEYGLDSILMDSVKTSKVDVSFEEPDALAALTCSGFLHSVPFQILLN